MSRVARAPNHAYAFSAALFEEWARSGIRHVCVCPGSRSAPLAVAAAQQPGLRCITHVDERAAAFFALGLAKASRTPVALVCTSGTAAANFLPAVVEAHHARVPLLLLTADRPPELREWGAGQTIDQVRLYGTHVRWFAEAPVPEATDALVRQARALACRAVAESRGPTPGPVHLNLPFREPLDPQPRPGELPASLAPLAAEGRATRAYSVERRALDAPDPEQIAELLALVREHPRGLIAAGPMDAHPDLVDAAARLARVGFWPLLAEPTSQMRCGPHAASTPLIAASDLWLRDASLRARLAPEVVLRLGAPPTSKSFRLWLEAHPPERLLVVDPGRGFEDPSHLASDVLRVDPAALCDALARRLESRAPQADRAEYLAGVLQAERRARDAIERALAAREALLSPRAVRLLAETIPDGALLYVSSSLPVRDLDAYWPIAARPLRVLANRGANGIDGVVSSALGAAAAGAGPVCLLTGDLAFLHDAGGLLAAQRHGLRAVIVVLDNAGGGIFSLLPIAERLDPASFEALFRVPHGADLAAIASAYGARTQRVGSLEHLRSALKEGFTSDGVSVVIAPIDAEADLAHRREIASAVAEAAA